MRMMAWASALGVILSGPVFGGAIWDKAKEIGGSAVEIVGETASDVGKTVSGEKESPEAARAKLDSMASAALDRLTKERSEVRRHLEASAGYAVFDSRRMSLLIATGFGQGVAVDRRSGKRVYMKMATGGVNLGFGAQFYQVIFLFPGSSSYHDFVNKGWDAGAGADLVAGKDAEGVALRLPDGTRVYQLNEKGVMLTATLTGTKYWQSDELNEGLE